MIIDFNKNNGGGGGDMSNYYTKSQVDAKVSQLEGEISASTADFYTSAQTETAIAEATENFVTSAETEQQIIDATPSIVEDERRKVILNLNGLQGKLSTVALFDFVEETQEIDGEEETYNRPVASLYLTDNQTNLLEMPDGDFGINAEIDLEERTITFTDIPAGSYKMLYYKEDNEDSTYNDQTFPCWVNSTRDGEEGEEILIHSTEDEEIQPLLFAYNTRWGNELIVSNGNDDNNLNWNFPKDVESLVIDLSDGVDIQITYKPTAEELIGSGLLGLGSVQDALENAGIYDESDEGIIHNVPQMIADGIAASGGTVDLSDYYTSAQTETAITSKGYITSADTTNFVSKTELLEKEEVISTALNELNDTKVASNFGSGHTVTAIWQGSQDDYNMLTQSGATANPTTFYIITGTTS